MPLSTWHISIQGYKCTFVLCNHYYCLWGILMILWPLSIVFRESRMAWSFSWEMMSKKNESLTRTYRWDAWYIYQMLNNLCSLGTNKPCSSTVWVHPVDIYTMSATFPRTPASRAFIEVFILRKSKIYLGKFHIHHVVGLNRKLCQVNPSGQSW